MHLFRRSKKKSLPASQGPPVDITPLVQQGFEHLQAKRWRDAISTLEAALASSPDAPAPHGYLAQAYARIGNGEAAIRHFEVFRKADPATAAKFAQQDPWLVAGRKVKPLGTSQRGQYTYESHACADPSMAKDFLLTRDVDRPNYYVDIETPDGIWGRDIDSVYQARLPQWKTDLDLADCDGSATGIPDSRGFEYCAKGMNDNFVIEVDCGRCEHSWLDALRYQDFTVTRCPSCGAYNKIGSHHYHSLLLKGD